MKRLFITISTLGLLVHCGSPPPPTEPAPHSPAANPTAPIADAGTSSTDASVGPAPEQLPDAAPPPEPVDAAPAPPPPVPKGTTVLHIGDSFAGALGIELNKRFREAGMKSVLRFKTASFIPGWSYGKELPVYLAQSKPDLVLITLGSNEVEMKNPEIRAKAIKNLIKRLDGRPCVWIGTPMWKKDTGILEVIRANSAPCRYMDSNQLVPDMPRTKDKIHPSMAARPRWAQTVFDWLQAQRKPDGERPWELKPEPAP